jgi:hypothetical protein
VKKKMCQEKIENKENPLTEKPEENENENGVCHLIDLCERNKNY